MAFSNHDIVPDSPTNNFATLNPLLGTSNGTFDDGNLKITTTANGTMNAGSTIAIPHTGKWYLEFVLSPTGIIGIGKDFTATTSGTSYGINEEGRIYINGTDTSGTNTERSWSTGDIISLLIDSSAISNNLSFYKNGTTSNKLIHQATYDLTTDNFFVLSSKFSSNTYINFGNDHTFGGYPNSLASSSGYPDSAGHGSFYYDPTQIASDVKALCTANLPEMTPTVADDTPQDYFKTVLYTGQTADSTFSDNGDGSWSKTDVGFQPDLVWLKARNQNYNHYVYDAVRGAGYLILPNLSLEEQNQTASFNSFDSDGFTVSQVVGDETNQSNTTYVAWCFRAGGSPSATDDGTGVSGSAKLVNTSGVASSTTCKSFKDAAVTAGASNVICPSKMSINQAAGFSIVKYTGTGANATVPHGLSSAPEVILAKDLDATQQWHCGFTEIGWGRHIHLDLPNAQSADGSSAWNNTAPAPFFFSLGGNSGTNANENDYIAYCFHSVEGFSKFGSYTGNGSPDGPFVYTGFRPAFLLAKRTTSTGGSWELRDSIREPFNDAQRTVLFADTADDELTDSYPVDFVSNGFKVRNDGNGTNSPGDTYIYMAFAEQPFNYANAR